MDVFLVVLLLAVMVLAATVVPMVVVGKGSKSRTGTTSVGWVLAAFFFGWIGVLCWAIFGAKAPSSTF